MMTMPGQAILETLGIRSLSAGYLLTRRGSQGLLHASSWQALEHGSACWGLRPIARKIALTTASGSNEDSLPSPSTRNMWSIIPTTISSFSSADGGSSDKCWRSSRRRRRMFSPLCGLAAVILAATAAHRESLSALSMNALQPKAMRRAGSVMAVRPGCSSSSNDWTNSSATAAVNASRLSK